jgi:23S rRNA U2552 (ribose-2'-O)-methylase RlmE/FtsJ
MAKRSKSREVFDRIRALRPERQVDLVLWNMYFAELALDMAANVLKAHGHALIKVVQGAAFQELVQDARPFRQGEASRGSGFAVAQS